MISPVFHTEEHICGQVHAQDVGGYLLLPFFGEHVVYWDHLQPCLGQHVEGCSFLSQQYFIDSSWQRAGWLLQKQKKKSKG